MADVDGGLELDVFLAPKPSMFIAVEPTLARMLATGADAAAELPLAAPLDEPPEEAEEDEEDEPEAAAPTELAAAFSLS